MFADALARRPRRRGADHLGHQRRARAARGSRPRWPTCSAATCCPSGTEADGRATGSASTTSATTSCGERASRAASGSCAFVRAPAAGDRRSIAGMSPSDVDVVRRACSTRRRSPSASPAASPPTSGRRCCSRSPTGCAALLLSPDRPVQFVFAGKAHPADDPGKELIRRSSTSPAIRTCATASCSSTTTTSPSPARCTKGATCG